MHSFMEILVMYKILTRETDTKLNRCDVIVKSWLTVSATANTLCPVYINNNTHTHTLHDLQLKRLMSEIRWHDLTETVDYSDRRWSRENVNGDCPRCCREKLPEFLLTIAGRDTKILFPFSAWKSNPRELTVMSRFEWGVLTTMFFSSGVEDCQVSTATLFSSGVVDGRTLDLMGLSTVILLWGFLWVLDTILKKLRHHAVHQREIQYF